MNKFHGTLIFENKPIIKSTFTIVGPKEKQSSLGKFFDVKLDDDKFKESTYEKAECKSKEEFNYQGTITI